MSDHHTYKKVELVGSSPSSIEDAINNALAEASYCQIWCMSRSGGIPI
ncbi:MAG: Dodecin [Pseudomonas fluorescens]|nr:MAG: Dodecin [Pseudomonas fluorescens]